jgi:glycosyltransferase involved in cell wall biosynthesis
MNILVINYEYPPIGGGGGVICKDISEEIASKGHRVTVVTSHYDSLPQHETSNGVTIIRLPVLMRGKKDVASYPSMISFVPLCVWKVSSLLRRERYDVINTHFAVPSGPAGQYISDKYGIPNVLSIHGGDIFDPSKSLSPHDTVGLKQTVRKMLKKADRVIAQSSDTKSNAEKYYEVDRKIDIVPLGIRPPSHSTKSRQDLGLPADKYVYSTIGRLIKRKNIADLLHIIKEIKITTPSVLLIMGTGPEMEFIENRIRDLRLEDAVRLLGSVSDEEKYEYLDASDGYLSTAIHEGFGIVFLEAMECGLPVICYDRGGQRDFLKNGRTGYLVELGNREEFASRMKELLRSPSLRAEIRSHNMEYVKGFYIGSVAEKYLSIFQEAVASSILRIMKKNPQEQLKEWRVPD